MAEPVKGKQIFEMLDEQKGWGAQLEKDPTINQGIANSPTFKRAFEASTSKDELEKQTESMTYALSELLPAYRHNYTAEERAKVLKKLDDVIKQFKENMAEYFDARIAEVDALSKRSATPEEKAAFDELKKELEKRKQQVAKDDLDEYEKRTKTLAERILKESGRQGEMYQWSLDFVADVGQKGEARTRDPGQRRDVVISVVNSPDLFDSMKDAPVLRQGKYYLTNRWHDISYGEPDSIREGLSKFFMPWFYNDQELEKDQSGLEVTVSKDHVTVRGPNYKRWGLNFPLAVLLGGTVAGAELASMAAPWIAFMMFATFPPTLPVVAALLLATFILPRIVEKSVDLLDYLCGRKELYRRMIKIAIAAGNKFDVAKAFEDYQYPEDALKVAIEEGIELVEPIPTEYQELVKSLKAEFAKEHVKHGAAKILNDFTGISKEVTQFRQYVDLMVMLSNGDDQLLPSQADRNVIDAINVRLASLNGIPNLQGTVPGNLPADATNQDVQNMLVSLNQFVKRNEVELSKPDNQKKVANLQNSMLDTIHESWFGEPRNVADDKKDGYFKKMKPWQQQRRLQFMAMAAGAADATREDKDTYQKHLDLVCKSAFNEDERDKFIEVLILNENAASKGGIPAEQRDRLRKINGDMLERLYNQDPAAHASWNEVLTEVLTNAEQMPSVPPVDKIPEEVRQQFYQHIASDETRFNAALKEIAKLSDAPVAPTRSKTDVKGNLRDYFHDNPENFNKLPENVQRDLFFTQDWDAARLTQALNNMHGAAPVQYSAEAKASLILSKYSNSPGEQLRALANVRPKSQQAVVYDNLPAETKEFAQAYQALCEELSKPPLPVPPDPAYDAAIEARDKAISDAFRRLPIEQREKLYKFVITANPISTIPGRLVISNLTEEQRTGRERPSGLIGCVNHYIVSPKANMAPDPPSRARSSLLGAAAGFVAEFDPPLHGRVLWDILTDPKLFAPGGGVFSLRQVIDAKAILDATSGEWKAGKVESEMKAILDSGENNVIKLQKCGQLLEQHMIKGIFDNVHYPSDEAKVVRLREILSREPVNGHSDLGKEVLRLLDNGDNYSDILEACEAKIELVGPAAFTRPS